MKNREHTRKCQCCAIVGAGDLVSQIWRCETETELPEYRFTIEVVDAVPDRCSQLFRPTHLVAVTNLLRVVTRELLHDGGFTVQDKVWLNHLADCLEVAGDCMKELERPFVLPNNDAAAMFAIVNAIRTLSDRTLRQMEGICAQADELSNRLRRKPSIWKNGEQG